MAGPGFAVIDFETTGLFPGGHDRVIEVAIVHVDEHGRVEGQWETLVNPNRDLGKQEIHRIRVVDVLDAPTFAQIAPQLIDLLDGRVVVAHNASFDTRFLIAELERAGHQAPSELVFLCTMQLARDFLPGAGRSLADCCAAYDIELVNAHRASVDAAATAQLLAAYIDSSEDLEFWNHYIGEAGSSKWPFAAPQAVEWRPRPPRAVATSAGASFLERITVKLPEFAGPAEYLDYLALLDRCLLDRRLSAHEVNALVHTAESLGLDHASVRALHLVYFEELVGIAWSDGVLSTDELNDLVQVATVLEIEPGPIAAALSGPRRPPAHRADHDVSALIPASALGFALQPGDLIVLTGDMSRSRSDWELDLIAAGYVPKAAVTKKVRVVVAADPDSLSGKARKARDYGIPIVDEAALLRLIGV